MTTDTPNWRQFARDVCWSPAISNALWSLSTERMSWRRVARRRGRGRMPDHLIIGASHGAALDPLPSLRVKPHTTKPGEPHDGF
jgi:hypothetical protein